MFIERRFDVRVRTWSSSMFILRVVFYLALAIYAPSLAVSEVTGFPLWLAILVTGVLTTIYTTLGGMKAVIWAQSRTVFSVAVTMLGNRPASRFARQGGVAASR